MEKVHAIELKNITKTFGRITANKNVNLYVDKGVVMSLLGENGSGKTTLMNMLAGIYFPDEGEIYIDGKPVSIRSPKDAYDHHIGMIHQHFKLVDVFTAAENIVLGLNEEGKLDHKKIVEKVSSIANKYGFEIDPNKKIYDMSVSEKQTVEILKVLYRGADVLILDEPTAGQDYRHYTEIMEFLKKINETYGITIIMITHDMHLMLEYTDRAIVIADGHLIADDKPAKVLTNEEIADKAYLKKTSLYDLAVNCEIDHPSEFVERFIAYERKNRWKEEKEAHV